MTTKEKLIAYHLTCYVEAVGDVMGRVADKRLTIDDATSRLKVMLARQVEKLNNVEKEAEDYDKQPRSSGSEQSSNG